MSLVDVGATLLDFAGADALPEQDGRSLRPLLCEESGHERWPDVAYAEQYCETDDSPGFMIRRGRYKFTWYPRGDYVSLTDMRNDPSETTNLADVPAYRAVLHELWREAAHYWSADFVRQRIARNRAQKRAVLQCGHKLIPQHADDLQLPDYPDDFDRFDPPHDWRRRLGVDGSS